MIAARIACLVAVLGALGGGAGCRPPPVIENIATPPVGVSVALYQDGETSYGVIDDRRWVEVTGTALVVEDVDPGAALPSLVIEPLGTTSLTVGQCAREHVSYPADASDAILEKLTTQLAETRELVRALGGDPEDDSNDEPDVDPDAASEPPPAPAPLVMSTLRCQVTGAPGRHLVRLLYVSPGSGYRAQHDITMTASDRATVATRFAIETPAWSGRADVTLFHGLPGGQQAPKPIARGSVRLDGSTAVLAASPRELRAQLRWIYEGAIRVQRVAETDAMWGRDSYRAVWVWLELEDSELPPGPVHAHVEAPGEAIRDVVVPAGGREAVGPMVRLPLWIDDSLHGMRTRVVMGADGASLADRFVISVANKSSTAREVWVEERLRTTKRRTLRSGWPTKPTLSHGRARTKLLIKPGAMERTGYVIEYVF
ncbi:MAG: hypothetical protein H0T42_19695 [Deltaproteobacteria bacterium]|nr:hypothetical protein [Deltaproteobacteria bacterium]